VATTKKAAKKKAAKKKAAKKKAAKRKALSVSSVVGPHPSANVPFGVWLSHQDVLTDHGVPHRAMEENEGTRDAAVDALVPLLATHHASEDKLKRIRGQQELLKKHGFPKDAERVTAYPSNAKTQRGNFTEVLLAEYITASSEVDIPIYRLRYNPNIDESMKGDDVLAFDLDADPPRLVVGEAKFRGTPGKAVVVEIVDNLSKSCRAGIPASLQFVADRLFEEGRAELGARILQCILSLAQGNLRRDYVGLLLSNHNAGANVQQHATTETHRLAVISVGLENPADVVERCFSAMEPEYDDPE
jgi:hypothetical protein